MRNKIIRGAIVSSLLFLASCNRTGVILYPEVPGLETSDIYTVTVNGHEIWTEKVLTDMNLGLLPDWFTGRA